MYIDIYIYVYIHIHIHIYILAGGWVLELLRHGHADVLSVEIVLDVHHAPAHLRSSGGEGAAGVCGGGGGHMPGNSSDSLFVAAAIQKNLFEQLLQASEPKKQRWKTQAARVCAYVGVCVCVCMCYAYIYIYT